MSKWCSWVNFLENVVLFLLFRDRFLLGQVPPSVSKLAIDFKYLIKAGW